MTLEPLEETSLFQLTAKHIALVLVVVGLLISGYLSYVKFLDVPIICSENQTFSCSTVQASRWSTLLDIPIAYLGFGLYLLIGSLLLLEDSTDFLAEYGRLLIFTLGIIGWLFSMWLVYIQAFIILAFCQWCLAHEFNFTLLFGVIIYLLWDHLRE
ncbi:MAG: vitamin K epoxide reductase family protein [Phototrophicaceae bacterium]